MKDQIKVAQRAAKLRELINDYRYHYHVLNQSTMSEAAADSLKHELSQIESKFPNLITPDSPTQRVAGEPLPGFKQIRHSSRMLSLNDVFDETELNAWIDRLNKLAPNAKLEFFTDIKMDGLAAALVYQDGVFTQAITRGDGFVGEDVSSNVRTIESVPLKLRAPKKHQEFLKGRTEIRGEIVMYKKDFERLNAVQAKAGKPSFANPRNTAAGTIRQLDPRLVAARPLHFHAYDLIRADKSEVPTNDFAYTILRELGVVANSFAATASDAKAILKFYKHWEKKRGRLPFHTDGLVIKINDRRLHDRLGIVGKAPRASAAFKYPAEQAATSVRDIFVSIGRTGSATPVAMLEPVKVSGSTVQMATLHNEGEVARKDIRVGDTVILQKAGDVIPEVVRPLTELRTGLEKNFVMPRLCPDCQTKLVKAKETEAVWRCPNNACPSRQWKQIQHFASKSALDIEGLGEKNVIALTTAGLIRDQADIYKVKVNDLLKLERFAEISAQKLVNAIAAKKQPSLWRFIYGLGIRHIGVQSSIDLANHFHSLARLSKATLDQLSQVEGIGEVVAEAVVEWFEQPTHQKLLTKFKKLGVWPKPVIQVTGPLSGVNIVVTGSLESMSREEAAERIRAKGGTFQSSIGQETDYLVVGDNVGASKLAKAAKLGTRQIDEPKLLDLLSK